MEDDEAYSCQKLCIFIQFKWFFLCMDPLHDHITFSKMGDGAFQAADLYPLVLRSTPTFSYRID